LAQFVSPYDEHDVLETCRAVIPNQGSAVPWGTANTSYGYREK